jgi:hypothetical protein
MKIKAPHGRSNAGLMGAELAEAVPTVEPAHAGSLRTA